MKNHVKKIFIILIVLGLVGTASAAYFWREKGDLPAYRTAEVTRGDLLVSISATGTVEPEEVIDVGAQVAGQILSFGKDANGKTVDYGSVVEEGTVLARIDDSLYEADAAQAEAQVQSARASLQRAEADLEQLKAKLDRLNATGSAPRSWGLPRPWPRRAMTPIESAYETAKANVAVGEAAILQAKASWPKPRRCFGAPSGIWATARSNRRSKASSLTAGSISARRWWPA